MTCLRRRSKSVDLLVDTLRLESSQCRLGGGGMRGVHVRAGVLRSFFRNREGVRFRRWVNRELSLLNDCELLLLRWTFGSLD